MNKVMTAAVALSLVGSAAFAGGPVVVIDEPAPVVVAEPASSTAGWIPLALGAVVLCAVACGSDS